MAVSALTLAYDALSTSFTETGNKINLFSNKSDHDSFTHNNPHAKFYKNDQALKNAINGFITTFQIATNNIEYYFGNDKGYIKFRNNFKLQYINSYALGQGIPGNVSGVDGYWIYNFYIPFDELVVGAQVTPYLINIADANHYRYNVSAQIYNVSKDNITIYKQFHSDSTVEPMHVMILAYGV